MPAIGSSPCKEHAPSLAGRYPSARDVTVVLSTAVWCLVMSGFDARYSRSPYPVEMRESAFSPFPCLVYVCILLSLEEKMMCQTDHVVTHERTYVFFSLCPARGNTRHFISGRTARPPPPPPRLSKILPMRASRHRSRIGRPHPLRQRQRQQV